MVDKQEDAIEMLLTQFHPSYPKMFSLAGTIKLDTYAISIMVIIMVIAIYRTLKNKDSVSL